MYRNKINNLVKEDKENLIEYLVTFDKTLLNNYKNDAEKLCDIFNFDLKYLTVDSINVKSYLKNQDDKFLIVVNKKLKEKEKTMQIYKELITYFIIRYFVDEGKIKDEELNISHYYFHYPNGYSELEIDFISDYFSKVLLNSDKDEYTKKEEKELRRLKYKLVRMDK